MLKKQFQCSTHCRVNGFTVLELLVVVAILAAVAMIATSSFMGGGRNVETEAKIKIAKAEMAAIAKAVKQFRADTGYYPKEGIFAHEDDGGQTIGSSKNLHNISKLDNYLLSVGTSSAITYSHRENAFFKEEFYAPYNLDQLFFQPTNSTSTATNPTNRALLKWDHKKGYGWNGPYLSRVPAYVGSTKAFCTVVNRDGVLDVDYADSIDGYSSYCDSYTDRDPSFSGYSFYVPDAKYPSLFDPFSQTQGQSNKPWFYWTTIKNPNPNDSANKAMFLDQVGSPYMVFGLNHTRPVEPELNLLRVVSFGIDGEYEGLSNYSLTTSRENCTPNTSGESASIKIGYKRELVLCF